MKRTVHTRLTATLSLFVAPLLATALATALAPAPAQAVLASYSAPLTTAIGSLSVATENNTGYDRNRFRHWVDADGDGCHARNEVLIAEADDPVTVGSGCSLSGGRWFSYYDRVSWTNTSDVDIDHMVPLSEAWGSGARNWTDGQREAFANDLGDYRTLVGVTDNVNQAKGDKDPSEWLPQYDKCRYLGEFVAVKIRWRLSVNSGEKSAMQSLAAGCANVTITVTYAI